MPLLVDFLKSPIRSCLISYHKTVSQNIQSHSFHNSGGKETVLPTPAATRSLRIFGKKRDGLGTLATRRRLLNSGGKEVALKLRPQRDRSETPAATRRLGTTGGIETVREVRRQKDGSGTLVSRRRHWNSSGNKTAPKVLLRNSTLFVTSSPCV